MLQIFEVAHKAIGKPIFAPAMSREARDIVSTILTAFDQRGHTVGARSPLIESFATGYQAAAYEDAVLGFDSRKLIKKLQLILKKEKNPDLLMQAAWLGPLFSQEWDVPQMVETQFRFSHSASQTEAYDWLMRYFILEDFSRFDLPKLVEIVRQNSIDDIKAMCHSLNNPEQHSIPYLLKCLKNQQQSTTAIVEKNDILTRESCEAISQMLKAQEFVGKVKPVNNEDWLENARITRAMLDGDKDAKLS